VDHGADVATEASAATSSKPASTDDYLGNFALSPQFVMRVFMRGERLHVQATGQQPLQLDARGNDVFAIVGVAAELHFSRDAAGQVTGLALHQNGMIQHAPRQ
jgi:hypothetical protein